MRLPEDIARLRSEAHAHKVRAAYHRRRLRETMAKLAHACEQFGIPVPPLPNAQSPRRHSGYGDDGDQD
jgi:hypothetical protein